MSDLLPRLSAALEGRYAIEGQLGQGGMATVYLADDLKHERKVALKVLKPELAAVIGADRFLSEIKTTANLQHPHILPLFDSGEADGFLFYVMPYVDGETLRQKLDRERQLGVDEAVGITRAVASALQYAHDLDVIHRDIKPANILIHAGQAVVADFGIALAVSEAGDGRLTETGLSLGTPHYMSPEQATADRDLSNRSDVYSLGCVLYEMLTGAPPHTGPTAQSVLVRILTEPPRPVTDVRAAVPPHVAAAIAKALEKLPADRFEDASAFASALDDRAFQYTAAHRAPATGLATAAAASAPASKRGTVPALPTLLVLASALALAGWGWLRPAAPVAVEPSVRFTIDLSDITLRPFDEIIISPDGQHFAVTGTLDGERGLFVRSSDDESFRRLTGPVDPSFPGFSPAGDWIVYAEDSDESLMKVSLSGGAPRPVVPASAELDPAFPHWGEDGTIVFSGQPSRQEIGVFRVPDTGGEATRLVEGNYFFPRLLPGGNGVLLADGDRTSTVYLDIAADTVLDLIEGAIHARYVHEAGSILYSDVSGGLWAVPFDVERGVTSGSAVPVLDGVMTNFDIFARFSVSENGTLVYGTGPGNGRGRAPRTELVVSTLRGDETVLPLAPRLFGDVRWSPDGESVAYAGNEPGADFSRSIYVYNVELGTTPRQITFGDVDFDPVWSPDGQRVAFASRSDSTDGSDLFLKSVADDTPPVGLLSLPDRQAPTDWVTDDLMLIENSASGTFDLWTIRVPDSTSAEPYHTEENFVGRGTVSPQGDLAAYVSDESGAREVYVRSFPTPRQKVIVSQGGGDYPRWSPDGLTLYYWRGDPDSLFAAHITREPTFAVLQREFLLSGDFSSFSWDLHPDGDRFIVPRLVQDGPTGEDGEETVPERHIVVVNWFTELRAKMGGGG
jgi:eukaryotic-like serine/threonine-protein kinase